jgi:DNA-directed RNA polymerase subunit RPC12/RpoP
MRYFIPIDLTTIKRNERAGASVTKYPGMARASATFVFGHRDRAIGQDIQRAIESLILFADGWVVRAAYHEEDFIIWHEMDAVLSPGGGALLERLAKSVRALVEAAGGRLDPDRSSIVFERDVQTAMHAPIPTFSCDHVPTEVECDECGERFPHTELESDDDDDGWTDTRCPRCGAWGCCELEFERLDIKGAPLGKQTNEDGRFERGSC